MYTKEYEINIYYKDSKHYKELKNINSNSSLNKYMDKYGLYIADEKIDKDCEDTITIILKPYGIENYLSFPKIPTPHKYYIETLEKSNPNWQQEYKEIKEARKNIK